MNDTRKRRPTLQDIADLTGVTKMTVSRYLRDPSAVAELARTLPLSDQAAGDQPWCDRQAEVERTLSHDFGEEKVATGARGMVLWGSELMGTWTMVLERADATSCVVASGIGYSDTTSPQVFFSKAGLNG